MLSIETLLGWVPRGNNTAPVPLTEDTRGVARRLIAETLPRLDEVRRLVMALFYYEELTVPEISKALGISSAEVRAIQIETVAMLGREIEARLRGVPSAPQESRQ